VGTISPDGWEWLTAHRNTASVDHDSCVAFYDDLVTQGFDDREILDILTELIVRVIAPQN